LGTFIRHVIATSANVAVFANPENVLDEEDKASSPSSFDNITRVFLLALLDTLKGSPLRECFFQNQSCRRNTLAMCIESDTQIVQST
jgi:hypothetical protein